MTGSYQSRPSLRATWESTSFFGWRVVNDECVQRLVEDRKQEEREEEKCREARQCEELKRAQYRPLSYTNPAEILPRGLQILAEESDNVEEGFKFPYPSVLAKLDITLSDWERFRSAIIGRFTPCGGGRFHHPRISDFEIHTIAKNIEFVLDNVAEIDIAFFRPRGLIMRMDMPGEQKFGLDGMDLYFGSANQLNHPIHNVSKIEITAEDHVAYCAKSPSKICPECRWTKDTPNSHHRGIRRKFFEGTRIVIDPLTVLDSPKKAYERGWTNWIQQSKYAKEKKPCEEDKPPPLLVDAKANVKYFKALRAYLEPMMLRPISERVFRWPPSKQIYYDRWRGHTGNWRIQVRVGKSSQTKYLPMWIPWADSMDKRMDTQWTPKCVVPADEIGIMMMERECYPKDHCPSKNCKAKFAWNNDPPTSHEIAFPPLLSELKAAARKYNWLGQEERARHKREDRKRRQQNSYGSGLTNGLGLGHESSSYHSGGH